MAYIGTDINYGNIASQTGVGDGTTTPIATLSYSVPTSSSIMVTLDGVTQVPTTDYTAVGTTLTFTSTVASPIAILVYFLGRSLDIGTPADNTVGLAQLSATGTASASTVLKGNNTWVAESTGSPSLGTSHIIRTNALTIAETITFAGTENGITIGPITVSSGVITVTSPSTWIII